MAEPTGTIKADVKNLDFHYSSGHHALKDLNMPIAENRVTALIGPSGCGKSTFLRCFNRMHDLYPGNRYEGEIVLHPDDVNILSRDVDPIEVRMRISMVFQKPNPFPKSIYENVAYGLRVRGVRRRNVIEEKVEQALQRSPKMAYEGGQIYATPRIASVFQTASNEADRLKDEFVSTEHLLIAIAEISLSPMGLSLVSKVAPPQVSSDQKPTSSSWAAIGSMSSVRMRVARSDWCPSRSATSVMRTFRPGAG